MNILPPLLPELDGSRPGPGPRGQAACTIRLGARVVAIAGADALIATGHGRALLQGAPSLRPGAVLVLELPHAATATARTGRLVAVGQQRLQPPLPIRLQPVPPTRPDVAVRTAAPREVSLRLLGADHRPHTPAFTARLFVTPPEAGAVSSASSGTTAAPSGGAATRGSLSPGPSGRPDAVLPAHRAGAPVPSPPAAAHAGPSAVSAGTGGTLPGMPGALPEQFGVLMAQGQAAEAVVLPRDALGRTLLRAAGLTFQVEPPLDLPVGARLQLTFPGAPASPAPRQDGPLEAVRRLAVLLGEHAGMEQPSQAGTLRLPEPDASLAARLLRLIQLIARAGDASRRNAGEPAAPEKQPGAARITAALAELGRLAGEPQSGGWRVLLLPLGFAGTPLLRVYVREDRGEGDGRRERPADRAVAVQRAVFELEFSQLGRAQIDVLCQARRFDLLMRTEQPLPRHLRRDIRELYWAARDVAGLVGAVRFHAGRLLALPEPAGAGGPGGAITV